MTPFSANESSGEVIIAGGQIFKIAASCSVDVSEEGINIMKENTLPRNNKHAKNFRVTLFSKVSCENCGKYNKETF